MEGQGDGPPTILSLNTVGIMGSLPHRYPFLMVDRILEVEPGKRAVGLKNVTVNEPFFTGHFPGQPIMPGVLILEAIAQVAIFMVKSLPGYAERLAMFTGIDNVRFRKPVVPGDQLLIETQMVRQRGHVGKVIGYARVDGEVACEGEIMYALAPPGYPFEDGEAT